MRKYLATILFTGCALAASPAFASSTVNETESAPMLSGQQSRFPLPGLRDEAAMVLVGTALIGLGAVVRRAA